MDKALWFISTCRNSLAVILGCLIAYLLEIYDQRPFHLLGECRLFENAVLLQALTLYLSIGEIKSGIPSFQIPPFSFERPEEFVPPSSNWTDMDGGNQTLGDTEEMTFDMILKDLGPGMILVPVVAILEQVAIAKAFCKCTK